MVYNEIHAYTCSLVCFDTIAKQKNRIHVFGAIDLCSVKRKLYDGIPIAQGFPLYALGISSSLLTSLVNLLRVDGQMEGQT